MATTRIHMDTLRHTPRSPIDLQCLGSNPKSYEGIKIAPWERDAHTWLDHQKSPRNSMTHGLMTFGGENAYDIAHQFVRTAGDVKDVIPDAAGGQRWSTCSDQALNAAAHIVVRELDFNPRDDGLQGLTESGITLGAQAIAHVFGNKSK